jgi:hypothetical protein
LRGLDRRSSAIVSVNAICGCVPQFGSKNVPNPSARTIPFAGVRIRFESKLGFERVLSNLRAVGEATVQHINALSAEAETWEAVERKVESHVRRSGFMLFATVDHGEWIQKFGIDRRSPPDTESSKLPVGQSAHVCLVFDHHG